MSLARTGIAVALALLIAACDRRDVTARGELDPARAALRLVDSSGAEVTPLQPDGDAIHCLLFVTVDCPLANNYAPEIQAIGSAYAGTRVRFWLVHVDPAVDLVTARRHATEFGHDMPILLDPRHELVTAVGATCTPEAAVVTQAGLAYRGRIDDWYAELGRKKPQPTTRELRDALDAVLSGRRPEPARTMPLGCFISDFK